MFCIQASQASIIKGKITDENNEPLSFVTVFIKGTTTGTTCNEQGFYELKLNAGVYDIGFQYIGYKIKFEHLEIKDDETKTLNMMLQSASYSLSEVNVNATAEDPAYPIIRQAMSMRKIYLFEPKEFNCLVYLKGMQRLTNVPKRVLLFKVPTDIKPGIVYLSESLSDLSYKQTDKIKERMISSKVSGDNKAFSFNRAGAIKFNVYENNINSFGLNERGFISPLASNAFLFYKYKLEGESKENGQTIYKIKLIPIREHDPVFRGHIYIIKDSWRIHSTDLLLSKAAQIEFVDTLYIKQVYGQQQGGVWMPVSQRFIFQFEAYGFRGNGYFVAVYSKYKVNSMYPETFYTKQQQQIKMDELVPQIKNIPKVKVDKRKDKDTSLFSKKYFNNEVMIVDKKANNNDDAIWDSVRLVPLTDEERVDYKTKDSIVAVHESKPYLDSIDKIDNKLGVSDIFITGYSYSNSFKMKYYSVTPLFAVVQYNTVEGWVLNPRLAISKTYEDNRYYSIIPNLRYGFASQKFYARLSYVYQSDAVKKTLWNISAGQFVEQFNGNIPITPAVNTFYTLLAEQNFLKEYQKSYVKLGYSSTIINGVSLNANMEYAQRSVLDNHTDYTFNDIKNRTFTSNYPLNTESIQTTFISHQAFIINVGFTFRFAQKYISRPDARYTFQSKYPVLSFGYTKGINGFGSSVDFDKVTFGVTHDMDFKLFGKNSIELKAGGFINSNNLYFMDYQHFSGNQTILALPGYHGFQLLDYYFYSTKQSFIEAHVNHHFNGFFINKIPLMRKLKWQEVFSLNYLKTPSSPNYIELGAGIEHIFKFMRVDFFSSFEDGKHMRNGIVIGFGF